MWHRLKVHTEDLAHKRFSCAKSSFFPLNKIKQFLFNSTTSIFLYINPLFPALKNISSKNRRIIKNNHVNM